jgi:hypothetical protein
MNVVIFWDIAPCSSYVNRRFGGTYHFHFRVEKQPTKKPECSRCRNVGSHTDYTRLSQKMATSKSMWARNQSAAGAETSVHIRTTHDSVTENGNIEKHVSKEPACRRWLDRCRNVGSHTDYTRLYVSKMATFIWTVICFLQLVIYNVITYWYSEVTDLHMKTSLSAWPII